MPDLEALNHGKPIASASARSSDSFSHGIPQRVAGYLAVLVVIAFGITACTTQLQIGPLSWTTAMPCARRAAGQCPPCQQPQAAAAPVPPVLAHVLMMTAFHWDTTHLSFLTQVINNVASYPTMTDFAISTNEPEKLENWRRTNTQGARAFRVHAATNTTGLYGLTWSHRDVVEDSLAKGNHTCMMYMEDDDFLTWEALLSWADDEAPLAALGFMRSFVRIETSPETGRIMLLDGGRPVNISTYDRKVTLDRPGCGVNGRFCNFIEPPQPYSSMWLLSRERVKYFVTSAYWRRETITVWSYGPSEMAANGLSLVDVPEGHVTTALTPYTDSDSIPIEATVAHLPNKYCTPEFRVPKDFCQVSYENFILR